MKTLKQWVRGWLDWLAVKLGYTPTADAELYRFEREQWRERCGVAMRRWNFAQDRLNRLMRYEHVKRVAANLDSGRARK